MRPRTLGLIQLCLALCLSTACTDDVLMANDADPGSGADGSAMTDGGAPSDADMNIEQPIEVEYTWLSETGLYDDIQTRAIAPDVMEYAPEYRTWHDGATARTFIWLPPGRRIDTSDMDYWYFPVGTKVWQELSRTVGGDQVLLETRMIQRTDTGDGPDQMWVGSFVWQNDESDALFTPSGAFNVRGTTHDVPQAAHCYSCHRGQPSAILGFAAVQLSYQADVNLNTLYADGLTSHGPETPDMYPIPGDALARDALGTLHTDCAHCHSSGRGLGTFEVTGLGTRLFVGARTVEATEAYQTNVDQRLISWTGSGYTHRVVSGSSNTSGTLYRMSVRGGRAQMPPRFTEVVNQAGVDAVQAWIDSL